VNATELDIDYGILGLLMVVELIYIVRDPFNREKILRANLWNAVLNVICGILALATHTLPAAYLHGGLAALCLFIWWHGGGGKNTKRRLKKLKEKFVGNRRTAPQTA
jgi:hypothetical protein